MNGPWPSGMMEEIESILSRHHEWPDGLDSYDAVFDSGRFFPLQRRRELEAMMRLCRSINPRTVMVIGADKGGDVFHFVKCLPRVSKVVACEIRGTPYGELFEKYFPNVSFKFMGSSRISIHEFTELNHWLVGKIDVLFIDGDKSAFREDFETYRQFMAPGGIALMHDICLAQTNGGCRRDFDSVAKNYRTEKIIDMSEHDEDREKQQRGEPVQNSYGEWIRRWNSVPTAGCGVIYL